MLRHALLRRMSRDTANYSQVDGQTYTWIVSAGKKQEFTGPPSEARFITRQHNQQHYCCASAWVS